MPALDRALALAEGEDVPVRIAEDLDLDVARGRDDLLEVERPVAERRVRLGRRGPVRVLEVVRRGDPPPPAVALRSTGNPIVAADSRIASKDAASSVPGTSGMPAARISRFASALSPSRSITSGDGPMKTRSFSAQARANAGFSARKP